MRAVLKSAISGATNGARTGAKAGVVVSALNASAAVLLIATHNSIIAASMDERERVVLTLNTLMGVSLALNNMIMAPVVGTVVGATVGAGKGLYTFFTADMEQTPKAMLDIPTTSQTLSNAAI